MPLKVRKRNRRLEKFQFHKLHVSVHHAFKRAGVRDHDRASAVVHEVRDALEHKRKRVVGVDEIERTVERVLRKHKLRKVVNSYKLVFLHLHKLKVKKVRKRDGRVQAFDPEKIFKSICKSFRMAGEVPDRRCDRLTRRAIYEIEKRYAGQVVAVEDIKKTVDKVLERGAPKKAARAYKLHRYM